MSTTYPPFDPEQLDRDLRPLYLERRAGGSEPLGPDTYLAKRAWDLDVTPPLDQVIAGRAVVWEDRVVPGPPGEPGVPIAVIRPAAGLTTPAAVYYIHGGGMYMGTRFLFLDALVDLVDAHGITVVSVEYRLAPEHPHPAPVEDSYAGLVWTAQNAADLGIDPRRVLVLGASAGGGIAAGVALLARDRGGPAIAGQALYCPMLDDRNNTVSARQHYHMAGWDGAANHWGWRFLLGDDAGGSDVSPYAAPARARDLSALPPAFIDVGECEVFRDEAVDYASRIWAEGGQAELHVWAGAYHGFTTDLPESTICRAAQAARTSWIMRVLDL
ncbi:alpha/beta hydrolase [Phytoactinopolyspora limicola]|uniref:alpha/beta hydrolase n=1 Tax=Phytoactinopolyspora limicola TaxID=2715536 RepID=UPI00140E1A2B|nr:alpha/beta hydrolase [Phytoactinopolyspora limicola]